MEIDLSYNDTNTQNLETTSGKTPIIGINPSIDNVETVVSIPDSALAVTLPSQIAKVDQSENERKKAEPIEVKENKKQYIRKISSSDKHRTHCIVCKTDVTGCPFFKCAECENVELCGTCFLNGAEFADHKKNHPYLISDNYNLPFMKDGFTTQKLALILNGLESSGFGNWKEIVNNIDEGESSKPKNMKESVLRMELERKAQECKDQYDRFLETKDRIPSIDQLVEPSFEAMKFEEEKIKARQDAQAQIGINDMLFNGIRKKGSYRGSAGNREESSPNPDILTKLGSIKLPGFYPNRTDFDIEHNNAAETGLMDMEFHDTDPPQERNLKLTMLRMYNHSMDIREARKEFVFRKDLLKFKQIQSREREMSDLELDIRRKTRIVESHITNDEYETLVAGYVREAQLNKEISELQKARSFGASKMKDVPDALKNAEQYDGSTSSLGGLSRPKSRKRARELEDHISNFKLPNMNNVPLDVSNMEFADKLNEKEKEICSQLRLRPVDFLACMDLVVKNAGLKGHLSMDAHNSTIVTDISKRDDVFDFLVCCHHDNPDPEPPIQSQMEPLPPAPSFPQRIKKQLPTPKSKVAQKPTSAQKRPQANIVGSSSGSNYTVSRFNSQNTSQKRPSAATKITERSIPQSNLNSNNNSSNNNAVNTNFRPVVPPVAPMKISTDGSTLPTIGKKIGKGPNKLLKQKQLQQARRQQQLLQQQQIQQIQQMQQRRTFHSPKATFNQLQQQQRKHDMQQKNVPGNQSPNRFKKPVGGKSLQHQQYFIAQQQQQQHQQQLRYQQQQQQQQQQHRRGIGQLMQQPQVGQIGQVENRQQHQHKQPPLFFNPQQPRQQRQQPQHQYSTLPAPMAPPKQAPTILQQQQQQRQQQQQQQQQQHQMSQFGYRQMPQQQHYQHQHYNVHPPQHHNQQQQQHAVVFAGNDIPDETPVDVSTLMSSLGQTSDDSAALEPESFEPQSEQPADDPPLDDLFESLKTIITQQSEEKLPTANGIPVIRPTPAGKLD